MLRLSPDVLSATCELLEWIKQKYIQKIEDVSYSQKISHIMIEELLDMAMACGLVNSQSSLLELTEKAESIIEAKERKDYSQAYRLVLYQYIIKIKPAWNGRIPYGRREVMPFMNVDEQASFFEAELLSDNPGKEDVIWWDKISTEIRGVIDERKNEVGRLGERATLRYERERTGIAPIWKSIDTNRAGFDIQSVQSDINTAARLIEVKSTISGIKNAWFHISSNEWDVARLSKYYYFYLWSFEGDNSKLAVVTPKMIENNMPVNSENGEWESVRIPFSLYESLFQVVGAGYENN